LSDQPSGEEEEEQQIIIPLDEPGLPPGEEISDPELPKTGEFPPVIYYGIGFFLILAGLMLGKYGARDKL
jgi:LPXTG-motif cell wall-anchored protein